MMIGTFNMFNIFLRLQSITAIGQSAIPSTAADALDDSSDNSDTLDGGAADALISVENLLGLLIQVGVGYVQLCKLTELLSAKPVCAPVWMGSSGSGVQTARTAPHCCCYFTRFDAFQIYDGFPNL